jgi:hypothetical protein
VKLRWVGHVADIELIGKFLQKFVGKSERNIPRGRHRRRWEYNTKTDLKETRCECVDWTERAFVNTIIDFLLPWKTRNFLTSWAIMSFSRRTLLRGVSWLMQHEVSVDITWIVLQLGAREPCAPAQDTSLQLTLADLHALIWQCARHFWNMCHFCLTNHVQLQASCMTERERHQGTRKCSRSSLAETRKLLICVQNLMRIPLDQNRSYRKRLSFVRVFLEINGSRWFESRQGLGIFLFTTASRPALGSTQSPIQWYQGIFPWV